MLISEAFAQAPGGVPGGGGLIGTFLPMILLFVLLYFLMIRPQMKRQKEHRQLIEGLQKGDEVVTGGGMLGRITKVSEHYVNVEIAPDTEIVVQRPTVQIVLPKGTLKSVQ